MAAPSLNEQVRFLLHVQRLLAEGGFVAIYKHALLLSMADVCFERGDDSGGALTVTTGDLAEKFISYYWRQSVPCHSAGHPGAVLRQNTRRQAAVISAVIRARYARLLLNAAQGRRGRVGQAEEESG